MATKLPHVKAFLSPGLLKKFKMKVCLDGTNMQKKLEGWITDYAKDIKLPEENSKAEAVKRSR